MQVELSIDGNRDMGTIIELPDGAELPNLDDRIVVSGELAGVYSIKERKFQLNLPDGSDKKFSWGWSLILTSTT